MRHNSMPAVIAAFVVATAPGCGVADPPAAQQTAALSERTGPALFPKDARPYGVSMERWSELVWKWIYRQPAESNPLLDPTGASCAVDQHGPVWFLPSVIPGGPRFVGERTCTIPGHTALLVQTAAFLNDYPCPDPAFRPAPGQSLYDFLLEGAASFIDTVYFLEVTIDGVPQPDMLRYRFTSDDLFHVRGYASLETVLDSCITGGPQPAVADGYVFMVKPLARGRHTLVWRREGSQPGLENHLGTVRRGDRSRGRPERSIRSPIRRMGNNSSGAMGSIGAGPAFVGGRTQSRTPIPAGGRSPRAPLQG